MIASATLVVLGLLAPMQTPILRFTKGETIRYKTTLSGSRSASVKGATQAMNYTGSSTMVIAVSSASPATASMKVSYTGSTAKATMTALPPDLRSKKAEIEKAAANGLSRGMAGAARSQTVNSRGVCTFTIPIGDGKTVNISDGAFMMLVLPGGALTAGKTWKASVRMPIPEATGSIKVTYKFAGMVNQGGQQAYKVAFSSSDSQSKTQGEISGKMSTALNGTVILSVAGKVLYGEVHRETSTTLTHKTQGTQSEKQSSTQTFTKL